MPQSSEQSVDELVRLTIRQFGELSKAELRLIQAAALGEMAVCGPTPSYLNSANDPSKADHWSENRQIRADLIRWLCVNKEASSRVDARGLRVMGAKISGSLDLSFATVSFPILFARCCIVEDSNLQNLRIPSLELLCCSAQSVDLQDADVLGSLFLHGAVTPIPVEVRASFGAVRLSGIRVRGNLACSHSTFDSSDSGDEDYALDAARADIGGAVNLSDGFSAIGQVIFTGAHIEGDVDCSRSTFKNPDGEAIYAADADIKGSVFLNDGFTATNEVQLHGIQIGGDLLCDQGTFNDLQLGSARVKGTLLWVEIQSPHQASLNLTNASVGRIADDRGSWPDSGNLLLDGLVYDRFASGSDANTRLEWLNRQGQFTRQPYRQLAKVLRDLGDDAGAKQVLFELEKRARSEARRWLLRSPARWCLQSGEDYALYSTVGYGVYPNRAVWYLFGLTTVGWIIHRRAQRVGAMVPTEKNACNEFSGGHIRSSYQPFSPLIYSLENCVPLVKLGQDERWQPGSDLSLCKPSRSATRIGRFFDHILDALVPDWAVNVVALRRLRWIMITLGWLLTTFFVAAISGIIESN